MFRLGHLEDLDKYVIRDCTFPEMTDLLADPGTGRKYPWLFDSKEAAEEFKRTHSPGFAARLITMRYGDYLSRCA